MIYYTRFRPKRTVAQLVEHDTFNVGVAGSIPASPIPSSANKRERTRSAVGDSISRVVLSYSFVHFELLYTFLHFELLNLHFTAVADNGYILRLFAKGLFMFYAITVTRSPFARFDVSLQCLLLRRPFVENVLICAPSNQKKLCQ